MPAWKLRRCEPSPQTARPQNGLPIPSKGRRTSGDTMDAAMAREAQTAAFDNFGNSPYTEANAMQDGDEEVGTRGGYGRRNLDGVDFSEEARRAEGKVPGEPAFSGTATANAGVSKNGGRVPGGETPEKVWKISGHRYAYGQPDAADYTAPVRTVADYPALTKISFPFPYPPTATGSGIFSFAETPGLAPSEAENAGNPQPGTSRVFCRNHGRNRSPKSVLPAIEFPARVSFLGSGASLTVRYNEKSHPPASLRKGGFS